MVPFLRAISATGLVSVAINILITHLILNVGVVDKGMRGKAVDAKGRRPLGVSVLSVLIALGAIGVVFNLGKGYAIFSGMILTGIAATSYYLIVIVVQALLAYGFWKGLDWGWWLGMTFFVISLVMMVGSILSFNQLSDFVSSHLNSSAQYATLAPSAKQMAVSITQNVLYATFAITLVYYLILIFYMTRKNVKGWFGV